MGLSRLLRGLSCCWLLCVRGPCMLWLEAPGSSTIQSQGQSQKPGGVLGSSLITSTKLGLVILAREQHQETEDLGLSLGSVQCQLYRWTLNLHCCWNHILAVKSHLFFAELLLEGFAHAFHGNSRPLTPLSPKPTVGHPPTPPLYGGETEAWSKSCSQDHMPVPQKLDESGKLRFST